MLIVKRWITEIQIHNICVLIPRCQLVHRSIQLYLSLHILTRCAITGTKVVCFFGLLFHWISWVLLSSQYIWMPLWIWWGRITAWCWQVSEFFSSLVFYKITNSLSHAFWIDHPFRRSFWFETPTLIYSFLAEVGENSCGTGKRLYQWSTTNRWDHIAISFYLLVVNAN